LYFLQLQFLIKIPQQLKKINALQSGVARGRVEPRGRRLRRGGAAGLVHPARASQRSSLWPRAALLLIFGWESLRAKEKSQEKAQVTKEKDFGLC